MMFETVEPDINFPIYRKRSLPAGLWEIGLTPMLFGVRVRMGQTDSTFVVLDYCIGPVMDIQFLWFGIICGICSYLPEEISENRLRALFPHQTIKPLALDPECVESLFTLRDRLREAEERASLN